MVDENDMKQQFYSTLMRLHSTDGDPSFVAGNTNREIFGEKMEDILMEIAMQEDENLDCCAVDIACDDFPSNNNHPLIAVSKSLLCDSRKNWKLRKVVFGSRQVFSA